MFLRDGEVHRLYRERVAEEIRDLLRCGSSVARNYELDSDQIECQDIAWPLRTSGASRVTEDSARVFDVRYP